VEETKLKRLIRLTVNDKNYEIAVKPNQTLADVIREEIGLTGTKKGCEMGECGTCTVLLDESRSIPAWSWLSRPTVAMS